MRMKSILCFICGFVMSLVVWSQDTLRINDTLSTITTGFSPVHRQSEFTKEQGDSAYMRHDYAAAIQIYEMLLNQGEAAEIYYNLGNSYYKSNNIAKAILNYERALLLSPGDSDIRANLEIARSKTVDKEVTVPEIFFITWGKSVINYFRADTWGEIGIICFFLFLIALCLFLLSKRVIVKKFGFISGLVILFVIILSNVFAWQQKQKLLERNKGIILQPSVTVRSTPSESGTGLFILHEGYKVEIKDNSMQEWKEIQLEDGKVGWLPTEVLEII